MDEPTRVTYEPTNAIQFVCHASWVEEVLIRFIWGLCSAQNALVSGAPPSGVSCDDLETIITANDEIISIYLRISRLKEGSRANYCRGQGKKDRVLDHKRVFAGEPSPLNRLEWGRHIFRFLK